MRSIILCLISLILPGLALAQIEKATALNGSQYAIIAPTFNGAGGNTSFIRLFNGGTAASNFIVTVLGSPSGNSYGTAQISIPAKASIQYAVSEILTRANAATLAGGDTSYSLYVQNNDQTAGYQHVLYNELNGFFENLTNCKTALNTGSGPNANSNFLLNVHTTTISTYPATIILHNPRSTAANLNLTLYDATTGSFVRGTEAASRFATSVGANATRAITLSEIQQTLGFTPTANQFHVNVQVADAAGGAADTITAQSIRNLVLGADLNMTTACSVAASVTSTPSTIGPGNLNALLNVTVGPSAYANMTAKGGETSGGFSPNLISVTASVGVPAILSTETLRVIAVNNQENTITLASTISGVSGGQSTYFVNGYNSFGNGTILISPSTNSFIASRIVFGLASTIPSLTALSYAGGNLATNVGGDLSFAANP